MSLNSGLSEKLNLDTYLLAESLPGVPVTDGIEMAFFPKLPLTELTDAGKVSATADPKNGRRSKSPAVAFLTASLAKARATVEKSVADTITGV
jgi:hypothetical protein